MKFNADELKTEAKKKAIELADFAKKETNSFKKDQWPVLKKNLIDGVKKIDEVTKGKGQIIFEKSKKAFKDGVRSLDQKVNGSSVHRDSNEDK